MNRTQKKTLVLLLGILVGLGILLAVQGLGVFAPEMGQRGRGHGRSNRLRLSLFMADALQLPQRSRQLPPQAQPRQDKAGDEADGDGAFVGAAFAGRSHGRGVVSNRSGAGAYRSLSGQLSCSLFGQALRRRNMANSTIHIERLWHGGRPALPLDCGPHRARRARPSPTETRRTSWRSTTRYSW